MASPAPAAAADRVNVVVEGAVLPGHDPVVVRTRLAELIRRDVDFAARLLGGRPTTIKSGVDVATGDRYVATLKRIGVAAHVEPEVLEIDANVYTHDAGKDVDRSVPPTHVSTPCGKPTSARAANSRTLISDVAGPEPNGATLAWRRLWARQLDFAICCALILPLGLLVGTMQLFMGAGPSSMLGLGILLTWLVLISYETLLLGALGTTLGKAVLGLRVESNSGARIDFDQGLRRSVGVWWHGSGAYLLFPITLVLWWMSYRRLRSTGSSSWDDACATQVVGGPISTWRTVFAGAIAIPVFALVLLFGAEAKKEWRQEIAREAPASGDRSHLASEASAKAPRPLAANIYDQFDKPDSSAASSPPARVSAHTLDTSITRESVARATEFVDYVVIDSVARKMIAPKGTDRGDWPSASDSYMDIRAWAMQRFPYLEGNGRIAQSLDTWYAQISVGLLQQQGITSGVFAGDGAAYLMAVQLVVNGVHSRGVVCDTIALDATSEAHQREAARLLRAGPNRIGWSRRCVPA